jgi:ABC-type transporter Mla subunit MlaD
MASENSAFVDASVPASLIALAEQLRDGPLQRLVELQTQTTALANRLTDSPPTIEDLEQLVRLSVSAMEHFNAFTREFAAVLRKLTDAQEPPH